MYQIVKMLVWLSCIATVSACEKIGVADDGGYEVHKSGNIVVMSTNEGCNIWDVSNPSKAIFLEQIPVGYSNGVRIRGDVLFISSESTLYSYNISDPGNPGLLGSLPCKIGTIFVKDDWLFIKEDGAVSIVDCTDPSDMIQIGRYVFPRAWYGWGIYAKDGYIYTANDNLWQLRYDYDGKISDPVPVAYPAWGLSCDDNYIYLATYINGIQIVDIRDSKNVKVVGTLNCGATWGITFSPGFIYTCDQHIGPRKIDISTLSSPVQIKKLKDSFAAHDILYDNGLLYCAGTYHGFFILDADDLSVVFD